MGYIRGGSLISLIMGTLSALLLLFAAHGLRKGLRNKKRWGLILALVTISTLELIFIGRFLSTLKVIPSGLFSLINLIVLVLLLLLIKANKLLIDK